MLPVLLRKLRQACIRLEIPFPATTLQLLCVAEYQLLRCSTGTVIQLVTAGLKERAEAGGLHGTGHAASTLDGVSDAANFVLVAFGDRFLQCGQSFMQVGDHRDIDLANRRLGHELAELGEGGGVNDQFLGVRALRLVNLGIVLAEELLQILRTKRFEQKAVGRGQAVSSSDQSIGAADEDDLVLVKLAKLRDQFRPTQAR